MYLWLPHIFLTVLSSCSAILCISKIVPLIRYQQRTAVIQLLAVVLTSGIQLLVNGVRHTHTLTYDFRHRENLPNIEFYCIHGTSFFFVSSMRNLRLLTTKLTGASNCFDKTLSLPRVKSLVHWYSIVYTMMLYVLVYLICTKVVHTNVHTHTRTHSETFAQKTSHTHNTYVSVNMYMERHAMKVLFFFFRISIVCRSKKT